MLISVTLRPGQSPPRSGEVRAGESWYDAACRVAGVERTDTGTPGAGRPDPRAVYPVDLSGETKIFTYDPTLSVAFRPVTRPDFAELVRWQQLPHVARWWHNENPDVAAAERNYGPVVDGTDPTRMWVVELNGRSVGFVQDYRIGDHPDYALLTAAPDAIGFDYAVGEPAWVGRGFGTRILWSYLRDVVRPHYPDATTYFAAPDHRNGASLRVLDKLGFARGLWFDEPQSDGRVDTVVSCVLDVGQVLGPCGSPPLSRT